MANHSNELLNGDGLKKVFQLLKYEIRDEIEKRGLNLSLRKVSYETDANKALETNCCYNFLNTNVPDTAQRHDYNNCVLYNTKLYLSEGGSHVIIQKLHYSTVSNVEIWERFVFVYELDPTHPRFDEWTRLDQQQLEDDTIEEIFNTVFN